MGDGSHCLRWNVGSRICQEKLSASSAMCFRPCVYQGSVPEYLRTKECPENSPEIGPGIKYGASAVTISFCILCLWNLWYPTCA